MFISHQNCLDEIIKVRGDNTYKTYKEKKEKEKDYLQKVEVSLDAMTVLAEEKLYEQCFTTSKKRAFIYKPKSQANDLRDEFEYY